jgi:tRNA (guanine37-N1)-methyltransferase
VGTFDSVEGDSFHSGLLDSAYYTRPAEYRGWTVPQVLLSGHHAQIARHRREQAMRRTFERRPELLENIELSAEDRRFLRALEAERKASPGGMTPA